VVRDAESVVNAVVEKDGSVETDRKDQRVAL
jgi:hypothetical protein